MCDPDRGYRNIGTAGIYGFAREAIFKVIPGNAPQGADKCSA